MVEGARRATGTIPPPESVRTTTENMTNDHPSDTPETGSNKKRRFLSAEKKFQIYLEAQSSDKPVGELLRREGLFSTDLARIRQQEKGTLVRLSAQPVRKAETVVFSEFEALKQELLEQERALSV